MRYFSFTSAASALLLLAAVAQAHKGVHDHLEAIHRRHRESRSSRRINETGHQEEAARELVKRGSCAFPYDAGLVPVTPGSANAGWAMSPDQTCSPNSYCPYACPPGQVMMQWDPSATSYTYPASMNGGLYCDSNGDISKPFPNQPYCQATESNIGVVNEAGSPVAFCQTVLPGNEAMLIPTVVQGTSSIAVPGTNYWAGTAAHYYINPPGTSAAQGCVWGTSANPWGNWAPYVAGANVDATGRTFMKLGWNPIYLEQATPFRNTMPNWGVKIDCPGGECGGLPCQIDPTLNNVNQMEGSASIGAGDAAFCVVTVPQGATANFVVFGSGSGSASASGGQFYQSSSASSSSTTSSTTISSSTTTSSTTTTTAASWTSTNSTTSFSESTSNSSSSWAAAATTTQSSSGPSGQPYLSLFNTDVASSTSTYIPSATAPTEPASAATLATSTGGAATMTWSVMAIMPLAFWTLLM